MTTVYWDYYERDGAVFDKGINLLSAPPALVIPQLVKERGGAHSDSFLNCPAFLDYYKNTFVVVSPFDVKLEIDPKQKYLQISTQSQSFYDTVIRNRCDLNNPLEPFIFSIVFNYLFIADQECLVEQLPASFHRCEVATKLRLVPGTFDVSKWYRPLEAAFEVVDGVTSVNIKRGDPLYYARFIPRNGNKIALKHKKFTDVQLDAVEQCTAVKGVMEKQPLTTLYKLTEKLRHLFKKKCPFNWRNK